MRVFKPKRKDANGKRISYRYWYVDIEDHLENRRRFPGFTSKSKSEELGRKVEDLVAAKIAGQRPDRELQRWIDDLPNSILKRLVSWGLIDNVRVESGRDLSIHLSDWKDSLIADGSTDQHANQKYQRVKRILDLCKYKRFCDISASQVQQKISKIKNIVLKAKGKGLKRRLIPTETDAASDSTKRYYLQACKQFTKWAFEDNRVSNNPLAHLTNIKAESEERAPLSPEELQWLLYETERSMERYRISGKERTLVYRFASETGFRAGEIRKLDVCDFDLENQRVKLAGKCTKNRKDAFLPLRADMVGLLKEHFRGKLPNAKAFKLPSKYNMAEMLRKDISYAREKWTEIAKDFPELYRQKVESKFLEWQKDQGNVDFHSLRHTFGTMLAASGVHPKVAQDLMRHSDINLTMSRYTHTLHGQTLEAVESLPDLGDLEAVELQATGTDGKALNGATRPHSGPKKPEVCVATSVAKNHALGRISADLGGQEGGKQSSQKSALLGPKNGFSAQNSNEGAGTRTQDLRLKRPLLYRLSYTSE